LVEIRIRNKYWKCFICDKKHSVKELYKAATTNTTTNYLSKNHNIRKSNERKNFAENEIDSEDDNSISGTVIPSFATNIIHDQIILKINKIAKSIIPNNLYE
jgi:hypothetical protein